VALTYRTLDFTAEFLQDLVRLSTADGRKIVKALELLDRNEKTPGLEVHQLTGALTGTWSVKASKGLRLTGLQAGRSHRRLTRKRRRPFDLRLCWSYSQTSDGLHRNGPRDFVEVGAV
jgi:mRNA-degrading endonuclease YafQ of YafQ-DinJ toxin-antitoxin module